MPFASDLALSPRFILANALLAHVDDVGVVVLLAVVQLVLGRLYTPVVVYSRINDVHDVVVRLRITARFSHPCAAKISLAGFSSIG